MGNGVERPGSNAKGAGGLSRPLDGDENAGCYVRLRPRPAERFFGGYPLPNSVLASSMEWQRSSSLRVAAFTSAYEQTAEAVAPWNWQGEDAGLRVEQHPRPYSHRWEFCAQKSNAPFAWNGMVPTGDERKRNIGKSLAQPFTLRRGRRQPVLGYLCL